jgi:5-methylcytosine-specific restriction endonuclease McrA
MNLSKLSQDQKQQVFIEAEMVIARMKSIQLEELEDADREQVASADGFRSLSEWTTAVLDQTPRSAKNLVRTMRRTIDRPDLRAALASGEVSFDRVEGLSRIPEDVGLLEHIDVAAVHREAAKRARITSEDEYRSADDRFLVLQPSLDESWWRLWGGLDGVSGAIVDKVLTEAADQLPTLPDGTRGDSSWRRATALVELAISDEPPPTQVTVFVDVEHAAGSNGQSGVFLEAGPGVARDAIEAILCDAVTEVTARGSDGRLMEYGRRSRTIPPALRRAILYRDGNRCAADGCDSRHRLQIHHVVPWSRGGNTDPENLITLCWFHHQVVVHQRGFTVYRHPEHGRIRFRRIDSRAPPH